MRCLNAKVYGAFEPVKARVYQGCKLHSDVYLKVAPTEIEIPVDGSSVIIQVVTNATYKIT
jgi:hypothetical protein